MRTISGCNLPKMLEQLPRDERLDWHETFALCGLAYTTQRFAERHGLRVPARLAKRLVQEQGQRLRIFCDFVQIAGSRVALGLQRFRVRDSGLRCQRLKII